MLKSMYLASTIEFLVIKVMLQRETDEDGAGSYSKIHKTCIDVEQIQII